MATVKDKLECHTFISNNSQQSFKLLSTYCLMYGEIDNDKNVSRIAIFVAIKRKKDKIILENMENVSFALIRIRK